MKAIIKKMGEVKKRNISLVRDTKAYNYKYATLDQIQSKLNPVLDELGLVVWHKVEEDNVFTRVVDIETGEFIESGISIKTQKAQERGSEITYYRRYNLVCLFDLEVEDDDGKKAQDSKPVKKEFGEKEYKALVEKKSEYIDALGVFGVLDEKGYTISKEREQKIKDLF